MRVPATLKALKFVFQGQSFTHARIQVADRRLAKALVASGRAATIDRWHDRNQQVHEDWALAYAMTLAPGGGMPSGQFQVLEAYEKLKERKARFGVRPYYAPGDGLARAHLQPLHRRFNYPGAPKLPPIPRPPVRSGSDADVGARVPMRLRRETADV